MQYSILDEVNIYIYAQDKCCPGPYKQVSLQHGYQQTLNLKSTLITRFALTVLNNLAGHPIKMTMPHSFHNFVALSLRHSSYLAHR